jgi:hypothetical protein
MNTESNPASRLHTLLQELLGGDNQERIIDAWARVLSVPQPHDVEVPRRLILLNDILGSTEQAIRLDPKLNHQLYLSCFPNIRVVMSPMHLQSTMMTTVYPHLTAEVMARLEFCSEALKGSWSETVISKEELQEISKELNSLIEAVAESDIDAQLKRALLEALEGVRIALSSYRIYGAEGLKKNLQGLLGFAFTERSKLQEEAKKNGDIIARFGKLLDQLDTASSTALKVYKVISKPVRSVLTWISNQDKDAPLEITEGDDEDSAGE